MTDSTYEGWKNWATWNVVLWIDNEYPWYQAKVAFLRRTTTLTEEKIEEFVIDLINGKTPDMDSMTEMGAVDWSEILEHWTAEALEL